jgi:hypothetical protein
MAMTTTEWITDIALLLIVFRQIKQGRLDAKFVLLPLAIVSFVAVKYLHSIPTDGNDPALIVSLVATGAVLGIGGGIFTRVRVDGRDVLIKAGAIAAALWVIGMGAREDAHQQPVRQGGDPGPGICRPPGDGLRPALETASPPSPEWAFFTVPGLLDASASAQGRVRSGYPASIVNPQLGVGMRLFKVTVTASPREHTAR